MDDTISRCKHDSLHSLLRQHKVLRSFGTTFTSCILYNIVSQNKCEHLRFKTNLLSILSGSYISIFVKKKKKKKLARKSKAIFCSQRSNFLPRPRSSRISLINFFPHNYCKIKFRKTRKLFRGNKFRRDSK